MSTGGDDVALKLLHTADWHLGKRFAAFSPQAQERLRHARLRVLDTVFAVAEQNQVHAVLCAGDLFDDPQPKEVWWRGLADKLRATPPVRPIFLLPGNHDPLIAGSVWDPGYGFRDLLPAHVHVVDKKNARYVLEGGAVLWASPCTSKAGQEDLALALPEREAADDGIRVGMVHGSTFQMKDWQSNFPIAKEAAGLRGLDYLAIGDTHGFREYREGEGPPTVYPSAPECCTFGESDTGYVALVLIKSSRRARVTKHSVASWRWETVHVRSLGELRALVARDDLGARVLRVTLDLRLTAGEYEEATRLLAALEGTEAQPPRAGVLELDRRGLVLDTRHIEDVFADMPDAIRETARRLQEKTRGDEADVARRALVHLYTLARRMT